METDYTHKLVYFNYKVDEYIYVHGFRLFTIEEYNKYFDPIDNCEIVTWDTDIDDYYRRKSEDFLDLFTIKNISKLEYDTLLSIFDVIYGTFPDFDDLELEDEEEL